MWFLLILLFLSLLDAIIFEPLLFLYDNLVNLKSSSNPHRTFSLLTAELRYFHYVEYFMSSRNLQEVYSQTGRRFNESASDLARQLAAKTSESRAADYSSPYSKEIMMAIRKGTFHQSGRHRWAEKFLDITGRPKEFITFTNKNLASVGAKEDAVTEQDIDLSELINVEEAEVRTATTEERKNHDIIPKTVIVEVVALNSILTVPESNNGVMLTVARDARCTTPEQSLIGGHIHQGHNAAVASSVFFPMFRLNTRDPFLSHALQIITVGSGFNLLPGAIVGSSTPLVAGEVTRSPYKLHVNRAILEIVNARNGAFEVSNAVPIVRNRPTEAAVSSVVVPWQSAVESLKYNPSSSTGNEARWTSGGGNKMNIKFDVPSLPFNSRQQEFEKAHTVPTDDHERLQAEFEETTTPEEKVASGLERLPEDRILFSSSFAISKTADSGKILKVFKVFDSFVKNGNVVPTLLDLLLNPVIKPILRMDLSFSISKMQTLPLILFWENEAFSREGTTVNVKRLLSLPSMISDQHTSNIHEHFDVIPIGQTGYFSPFATDEDAVGQFGIASLGHKLDVTSDIQLHVTFSLLKDSCIYNQTVPLTVKPFEQKLHSFYYSDSFTFSSIRSPLVLGMFKFSQDTPPNSLYELSLLPAHGYTEKQGKHIVYPAISGIFRLWNFWNGTAHLEIVSHSKISVAGSCSLYLMPAGFPKDKLTYTFLDKFYHVDLDFGGKKKKYMDICPNNWFGKNLTKGEDDYSLQESLMCEAKLLLVLKQPPTVDIGIGSSLVHVVVRVIGFSNVTCFEKSSRSKQAAAHILATVAENSPKEIFIPADEGGSSDTSKIDSVQALLPMNIENDFARLAIVTPVRGEHHNELGKYCTLAMPATFWLSRSMFKTGDAKTIAGASKLENGKVYLDVLNIYKDAFQAWTHYACDMEFLFYPYFASNICGNITVAHKLDTLDTGQYGISDVFVDNNLGGSGNSALNGRGQVIRLLIRKRDHLLRVSSRKRQDQRFIDNNGAIYVQFPDHEDFLALAIYARPVGLISVGGEAWSARDTQSEGRYRELTVSLGTVRI